MEKSGEFAKILPHFNLRTIDELFIIVGYGRILPEAVIGQIVPAETLANKQEIGRHEDETFLKRVFSAAKRRSEARNAISVANLDDVLIRFARSRGHDPHRDV
jgi:(p)ppGpp synthase/HD superfamily hydrolase